MCVNRFILSVIFFLVISGTAFFSPSVTEAGHKCCSKYTCSWGWHCSCPGQGNCPFLQSPTEDNNTFLASTSSTNGTVTISPLGASIDVERIMRLSKVGGCAHWNIVGRILDNGTESLKFPTLRLIQSY